MTDRDRLGADSLREIRERAERLKQAAKLIIEEPQTDDMRWAQITLNGWAYDMSRLAIQAEALVAEREALLERIRELEKQLLGGHGGAVSRKRR